MSADNYLLVSKSNFKVMSMCASTQRGVVVFKGKNLEEARNFAIGEEQDSYYEYGIHFTDDKIGNRYVDKMLEEKEEDMEAMENLVKGLEGRKNK